VPPQDKLRQTGDSRSFTLPGPDAVPRLVVDAGDMLWFDVPEESREVVELVDGTRSILVIAKERGLVPREVQLRIADLRSRGIVELC
jgi:hypothetical protein